MTETYASRQTGISRFYVRIVLAQFELGLRWLHDRASRCPICGSIYYTADDGACENCVDMYYGYVPGSRA